MPEDGLLQSAIAHDNWKTARGAETPEFPIVLTRSAPSRIEAQVYDPVLCLILQGTKTVETHHDRIALVPGDAILFAHDTPVLARVTSASPSVPYVAVILRLDLALLRDLRDLVGPDGGGDPRADRPVTRSPLGAEMRDVLHRWLKLTPGNPETRALAALCAREMHIRLLTAPEHGALRRLAVADSHASRIARAIGAIRRDPAAPLALANLQRVAGMGQSSFHAHFRAVTGTTPLQYQKDLRLTAARERLLGGPRSVGDVAFGVGYDSVSQFSREYARKFGHPPSADLPRSPAPA